MDTKERELETTELEEGFTMDNEAWRFAVARLERMDTFGDGWRIGHGGGGLKLDMRETYSECNGRRSHRTRNILVYSMYLNVVP